MNYKTLFICLLSLVVAIPAFASESPTYTLCTGLGCPVQGTVIGAPTANVAAGTYNATQSVTLTASGATSIRYTTDDSTPTCASTQYASAISVTSSATIKAISCYPNSATSTVASFAYVLQCATQTVSNGSVAAYPSCAISCNSGYALSGSSCNASGGGFVGGGGGGGSAPVTPATSISINAGASIASSRNVTLSLVAPSAAYMMISNLANFSDAISWDTFSSSKPWILTEGDGAKTVYAKFRTASGNEYNTIFDTITLQVGAVVPAVQASSTTSSGSQTSSGAQTGQTSGSSGTQTGSSASYTFSRPLSLGSSGADVRALQNRLISEGVYSGDVTGYYGAQTMAAVKRYQAKYGIDQLGNVGPATRAKLNAAVSSTPASLGTQNVASMTLKQLIQMLLQIGAIAADKVDAANRLINSL